jgi:CBS domain containing-hemolysin-like protein
VGEIRDEYDQGEELLYQVINPDEILFQGKIGIDDLNDLLGTHLSKEVSDTLAGFIYSEMGRVPVDNEELKVGEWALMIEQVSGRRIRKVRAKRLSAEPGIEEKKDDSEQ